MEHVNDVDLDCVLGLPVPDAADRIRYTQPRRRRKRSSEETTGGILLVICFYLNLLA